MHNSILANPPITEKSFNHTMQAWVEKFDGKLVMMVSTINLNTDKSMEAATDILKVQIASIATAMGAMAMEFQLANQHLRRIAQSLVTTLPSLLAHNHSIAHPQMHNGGAQASSTNSHHLPQMYATKKTQLPTPTQNYINISINKNTCI